MKEYLVRDVNGQSILHNDKSLLGELLFVEGKNYVGLAPGRVYSKEPEPLTYKWISENQNWVVKLTYDHDKTRWVSDGGAHALPEEVMQAACGRSGEFLDFTADHHYPLDLPKLPKEWKPPFHVDPTSGDAWVVGCKTEDTVYYTESQEKAKAVCFALNMLYAEDGIISALDKFRRQ